MSATSPTTQNTTAAPLAGLPFAAVRGIVETMQCAFPTEHGRIGRGLQVLLASKIVDSPRTGRSLVQSTQDGILFYEATSLQCSCPDHRRHPELRCKHSWALDILSVASAIAARERAELAQRCANSCQACHYPADLIHGLCLDCLAREVGAAVDPDAAIPYELTPRAYTALEAPGCECFCHRTADYTCYRCRHLCAPAGVA